MGEAALPSIGSPSWAAPPARARLWGQPGNLGQDMPLARKLSKQAAPLVCSSPKQRILFPVPVPQGCSWASKLLLGQGIQGITSASSHEGIMDGSSPTAVPLAGMKPPQATGLSKPPVLGAGGDQGHAVPRQGRGSSSGLRATSTIPASGGGDSLADAACVSTFPGR